MNSHTLYEANKLSSLDYTKKRNVNVPNVSEMEGIRLQYGVGVDALFPVSTLRQYSNMECNNELHFPLTNYIISSSNN